MKTHIVLAAAILLAACGKFVSLQNAPAAAPPELLPRALLFGNPERSAPALSPDGQRIGFLAPVKGVMNVWVGPAGDFAAAKAVTQDSYRGIRGFSWAYDNRHVLFTQDQGGDENFHVYSVDLDSGKQRDLTPVKGVQARIFHLSHKHPGELLVGLNDRDKQWHDIYRVSLASGKRKLLEKNAGYNGYLADSNLEVRLAQQMHPNGDTEFFRKAADGSWQSLLRFPLDDEQNTGWQKVAGDVLYLTESQNRNTSALVALNLASGQREVLFENRRSDVNAVLFDPAADTPLAASSFYMKREWTALDESVAADLKTLQSLAEGTLTIASQTLDNRKWIVAVQASDQPTRYFLFERGAKQPVFLFSSQPEFDGKRLAQMRPLVVKSRDGLALVNHLTLPVESDPDGDGEPARPLPLVLLIHGGPWARDFWGFNPSHQWLANRGYAVMSVNYRGSTGFGKEFVNAADGQWAAGMHDDVIDSANWAVAQKIADPARLAVFGGSYGGYAALVAATFTPDTFACNVDIVGPSSLITLIESFPPYWKPRLAMWRKRMGDETTEAGRKLLWERSPLSRVDHIQRPLLIGQGANDPRVTRKESDQIATAMQARNIPVTYALFPDEGHGFARPPNRQAFYAVAEGFLGRCLGGRVEPVGADFTGSSIQLKAGGDYVPGLPEVLGPRGKPAAGN